MTDESSESRETERFRDTTVEPNENVHRRVGLRLAEARRRTGMTQVDVARALETSQSRVARHELGTRRLTYVEALEYARLYKVDVLTFDPDSPDGQPASEEE